MRRFAPASIACFSLRALGHRTRVALLAVAATAAACAPPATLAAPREVSAGALLKPTARAGLETHRWGTLPANGVLTVWVDSAPALRGWTPALVAMAYDAAREWETAGVPVRFAPAFSADAADVRVHWRQSAPWPGRGATRRALDERRESRGADCWILLTVGGVVQSAEALRPVVLHELGHALGLAHDGAVTAIMADGSHAGVQPTAVTARDRASLRALYATTTLASRPASGTPTVTAAAGFDLPW